MNSSYSKNRLDEHDLVNYINKVMGNNEELSFIKDLARKLNLKAYLYGGAAAGLGNYSKWLYYRENGGKAGEDFRASLAYTSSLADIFLGSQDIGLAVDVGDGMHDSDFEGVYREFEIKLNEKYPYKWGGGRFSKWEIHTLRLRLQWAGTEKKRTPVINDNFRYQHTDSMSIGLIDLKNGSIRDLGMEIRGEQRQWFKEGLLTGSIKYLYSKRHDQTEYAINKENPPLFSIIRYIKSMFQYHLRGEDGDLEKIKLIVSRGKPLLGTEYARNWLESNTMKMFAGSSDDTGLSHYIEKIGLKDLLREMGVETVRREITIFG
jgi:hypothetical protein